MLVMYTTDSSSFTVSMAFYIFVGFIVFIIFLRKYNKNRRLNPKYRKLNTINGKLVKKRIDKMDELRNVVNLRRSYYGMNRHEKGTVNRYYLSFETEKGKMDFTVSKEEYNKLKVNKKGIITRNRKKFVSFKYFNY